MTFGPIDLLFNLIVLLFWVRLWNGGGRGAPAAHNPYLAGIEQFTQPVLDLLRTLLRVRAPAVLAATAWGLLLVFRAVALAFANPQAGRQGLGFEWIKPDSHQPWPTLVLLIFSLLSFAIFLFQIWGFALVFLHRYRREAPPDRATELLYAVARPYVAAPRAWRFVLLFGYGVLILAVVHGLVRGGAALYVSGEQGFAPYLPTAEGTGPALCARFGISTLAGLADLLSLYQTLLLVLILGSWVVLFTADSALGALCQEWLTLLLGPFRHWPLRLGPFDLTPVLAIFVAMAAHAALRYGLLHLLALALPNGV